MRLFAGIALPAAHQAVVDALRPRLAGLARGAASWTRQGNAHVTLKFLGAVSRDRVPAVTAALAGVRFAAFALQLGGGGFFPGPRRPRLVWAGVTAGGAACGALAAAVDGALAEVGFALEGRPFAAHVTLGRLRQPGRGGDWPGMLGVLESVVWPALAVEEFVLFESRLSAGGTQYAAVARFGATAG